jgi:hypothetical protein
MLATFASTFIFNHMYVRWQRVGEGKETVLPQATGPSSGGGSHKEVQEKKGPQ